MSRLTTMWISILSFSAWFVGFVGYMFYMSVMNDYLIKRHQTYRYTLSDPEDWGKAAFWPVVVFYYLITAPFGYFSRLVGHRLADRAEAKARAERQAKLEEDAAKARLQAQPSLGPNRTPQCPTCGQEKGQHVSA